LRENCFQKHVIEGKEEGRVGVTGRRGRRLSSYWITLKKIADTENWKRKHQISLVGELALEETKDLS
jgi:hypothetical protein